MKFMVVQSGVNSAMALWPLPRNAALHGTSLDQHLLLNLWIALALLALLHLLVFLGIAIRRRSHRGRQVVLLEYVPLALFTALFAFLALRAHHLWAAERYTGAAPQALQVDVIGMQFAWYFRYPGPDATFGQTSPALIAPGEGNPTGLDPKDDYGKDDVVASELVLPAGREVDLALRAADVIHGFAVPELRLKQNALPGETVHVHFTPVATGSYAILCTQVCGLGHYRMQATLRVVTPDEFGHWMHSKEHGQQSVGSST